MFDPEEIQALKNLVVNCAATCRGDSVLVISDTTTSDLGAALASEATKITSLVKHVVIAPLSAHGEEPPKAVEKLMTSSNVIFCLTKMSLAHTRARHLASLACARYLSLPDYNRELLVRPSLLVDFRALTQLADRLAESLSRGGKLHIFSHSGTDLQTEISGRRANSCPGWCRGPGSLASPPDAETNIAPIETSSQGIIVVDGSIPFPGLGLLPEKLTLKVSEGRIIEGSGRYYQDLVDILGQDVMSPARILAEVGIGLNPMAKLCGIMLEDEGCLGTIHFGFGSNWTIGGANKAALHLDAIIMKPSLRIDGRLVIDDGEIIYY